MTKAYVLLTGKHSRFETKKVGENEITEPVMYRKGETIELTDEEAKPLLEKGRIEAVASAPDSSAASAPVSKAKK